MLSVKMPGAHWLIKEDAFLFLNSPLCIWRWQVHKRFSLLLNDIRALPHTVMADSECDNETSLTSLLDQAVVWPITNLSKLSFFTSCLSLLVLCKLEAVASSFQTLKGLFYSLTFLHLPVSAFPPAAVEWIHRSSKSYSVWKGLFRELPLFSGWALCFL